LGLGRPLLSHSRSGAGRTAQPFLSQPRPRVAAGVVERPAGTLEPYGCSLRAPTGHSISRRRVVEAAALGLPLWGAVAAVAALLGAFELGGVELQASL